MPSFFQACRMPHVLVGFVIGRSMCVRSWLPVLAQEQLQLSEQQCDAMHAAHSAVLVQLRELFEARKSLSTRLQVRAGSMQQSMQWAALIPSTALSMSVAEAVR